MVTFTLQAASIRRLRSPLSSTSASRRSGKEEFLVEGQRPVGGGVRVRTPGAYRPHLARARATWHLACVAELCGGDVSLRLPVRSFGAYCGRGGQRQSGVDLGGAFGWVSVP